MFCTLSQKETKFGQTIKFDRFFWFNVFFTIYALRVSLELPAVVYSVLQGGCAGDSILELFVADYFVIFIAF